MQHRNNVDSVNKQLNRHKNMLLFTVWGDRGRGVNEYVMGSFSTDFITGSWPGIHIWPFIKQYYMNIKDFYGRHIEEFQKTVWEPTVLKRLCHSTSDIQKITI